MNVVVAATQMACGWDRTENIRTAERLVREAKGKGAQIILLQELFETPYFCQDQKQELFGLAAPVDENPAVLHFQKLAAELEVVLPISFFERANNAHYNSIAILDADGKRLGIYRKSHIPDGPGYREKFYFNPGDTGFKTWKTRYGRIGVGICWDQWFPEAARAMALKGAEILFYPTAIGSEPQDASIDSKEHWQTVMRGHAGANLTPLVSSNRIGRESMTDSENHLLRLIIHRRPAGSAFGGGAPGSRSGDHRQARPRCPPGSASIVGSVPRPPAGALRPAPHLGRRDEANLSSPRSGPFNRRYFNDFGGVLQAVALRGRRGKALVWTKLWCGQSLGRRKRRQLSSAT
jgi:N-carbamoylputrescine amidase